MVSLGVTFNRPLFIAFPIQDIRTVISHAFVFCGFFFNSKMHGKCWLIL